MLKSSYTTYMKIIFLSIFLFLLPLAAHTYVFSGGKNNVVQMTASKILIKAYARANIKIEPLFISLEESLQRSNAGITDGELARIKGITKLYPNLIRVPVCITSVEAMAFSKTNTIYIHNWHDLEGQNFTIVKGAKFIENATKMMHKDHVTSIQQAFNNLEDGTTDIIVIPKKTAIRMILKKEFKNIKPISEVLEKQDLYHFVYKKNAYLIPIITPILQRMQDNGEIKYMNSAFLRGVTR